MPRNAACLKCSLHFTCSNVCTWGAGATPAKIMLIGSDPGTDTGTAGLTFTGDAAEELDEVLTEVGIPRSAIYITSAVKCRLPRNREPDQSELNACFSYLAEEIAQVRPAVIVAMGRTALKAVTGKDTIKTIRGKPVPPSKFLRTDAQIIGTYAPAESMYSDHSYKPAMVEDFKLAALLAGLTKSDLPEHSIDYILPDSTYSDLQNALTKFVNSDEIAIDCEWTAGDVDEGTMWPWTPGAELFSVAISGRVDGAVHSVGIAWPPVGNSAKARRLIQRLCDTRRVGGHNLMSDLIWLTAEGFNIEPSEDSQFFGYLLDEEQGLALEKLAPKYAKIPSTWKFKSMLSPTLRRRKPVTTQQWRELLDYNTGDTYATLLTIEGQRTVLRGRSKLERKNIRRAYRKLLLPALPVFVSMALNGVPMDEDDLKRELDRLNYNIEECVQEIVRITGLSARTVDKTINSPKQLLVFLNQTYGLFLGSTDAESLEPYADQYPIIGLVTEYKHLRKLRGTYIEPWYNLVHRQGDGALHSVYRLDKSRTGRTTANTEEGGSIQLAPREDWLRRLIKARPNRRIVSADYSQAELRMIAWLGPERNMRKLFNDGADLHKATAGFIKAKRDHGLSAAQYRQNPEPYQATVTKTERQAAKGINFGFDFGMQVDKFIRYARKSYQAIFTQDEAEEARDGYFELYDDLEPWHNRMKEMHASGDPIVTPFGRYRRNATDVTQYINTPIQTTANDLAIFSSIYVMVKVVKTFDPKDVRVIGFIHDSIMFDAAEKCVEPLARIIKHTMEHPPLDEVDIGELPIPLLADVSAGPTWADSKELVLT